MSGSQGLRTKKITISSIVGSAAYRLGIADYQQGVAPRYDDPQVYRNGSAWDYERGRLFAAAMAGQNKPVPPTRAGRSVNRAAIRALAEQYGKDGVL